MKFSKTKVALVVLMAALGLTGCGEEDVGDVSLGIFTFKDIKINRFTDPITPLNVTARAPLPVR